MEHHSSVLRYATDGSTSQAISALGDFQADAVHTLKTGIFYEGGPVVDFLKTSRELFELTPINDTVKRRIAQLTGPVIFHGIHNSIIANLMEIDSETDFLAYFERRSIASMSRLIWSILQNDCYFTWFMEEWNLHSHHTIRDVFDFSYRTHHPFLHRFAYSDWVGAVDLFVRNGANIFLRNYEKFTPLQVAVKAQRKKAIEYFVAAYHGITGCRWEIRPETNQAIRSHGRW